METRAFHIDQGGDRASSLPGGVDRLDNVDGLAALGKGDCQAAFLDEMLEVHKLRTVGEVHLTSGDPREKILRDERRVGRRSTAEQVRSPSIANEIGKRL